MGQFKDNAHHQIYGNFYRFNYETSLQTASTFVKFKILKLKLQKLSQFLTSLSFFKLSQLQDEFVWISGAKPLCHIGIKRFNWTVPLYPQSKEKTSPDQY